MSEPDIYYTFWKWAIVGAAVWGGAVLAEGIWIIWLLYLIWKK